MIVTGPEDGGSVCTDWVGAVVSVSGANPRFPSLVDALDDGLFHARCRHRLLPYRPEEGEAEALFCTKLALAGMMQRGLDRGAARAPRPGSPLEEPQARFARIYDQAREAEQSRRPEMALHFCQEALALVSQQDVFGEDQPGIERVLRGRMQTILRAHQRPDAKGPPVA